MRRVSGADQCSTSASPSENEMAAIRLDFEPSDVLSAGQEYPERQSRWALFFSGLARVSRKGIQGVRE